MKIFDIHDRIFKFVVDTLRVIKYIPKGIESQVIVNQLVRSVTSVGANDQEADGVSSRRDFIHCYTVVRKELKETQYWLLILSELDPRLKIRLASLISESRELTKIISAIINNAAIKSGAKIS